MIVEWKLGQQVEPKDIGLIRMSTVAKKQLRIRGLDYCYFLMRIVPSDSMYDGKISIDGFRRSRLYLNALRRSREKCLPFDDRVMLELARSQLPVDFDGRPYKPLHDRGPASWMSLSVDRIVPRLGYVPGNVRFIPFGLNTLLQGFCDRKAARIIERFLVRRPRFLCEPIPVGLHCRAKKMASNLRSNARSRGRQVESCFTFDNLMDHHKFVDRCAYSGIRLNYKHYEKGGAWNSPSFYRIDPSGTYSCRNVEVIAMYVNALKQDVPLNRMHLAFRAIDYLSSEDFVETHVPTCTRVH